MTTSPVPPLVRAALRGIDRAQCGETGATIAAGHRVEYSPRLVVVEARFADAARKVEAVAALASEGLGCSALDLPDRRGTTTLLAIPMPPPEGGGYCVEDAGAGERSLWAFHRRDLLRLARALLMVLAFLALAAAFAWRVGPDSPELYGEGWDRSGYGGER